MAKSNSHIEKNCLYPACFNSLFLLFIWRLMFQLNPQKGSFLFFSEVLAVWHECPTIISLPIESANGLECGGRKKNVDFFICLIASFTVSCYQVKVWQHCVNLSSYRSHATGLCIKYQFLQHLWNVSKFKKKNGKALEVQRAVSHGLMTNRHFHLTVITFGMQVLQHNVHLSISNYTTEEREKLI